MSGILAGAFARGLGAAADKASDIATGYIDDERKLNVQEQLMRMEEEKSLRIDQIKRDRDRSDIVLNAEQKAKAAPIIARGEAEGQVAMTNTEGYLQSVKDKARAGHIDGVGAVATANAANYDLQKKRETDALITEIDAATEAGDAKKVERLTNKLNLIQGNKYGQRYDKAIVENTDGTKSLVVVDKVNGTASQPEIRRPGAAPTEGAGGPPVNKNYTYKSGN